MRKLLLALLVSASVMAAPALDTGHAIQLNKRGSADRRNSSGTHLYDASQFGLRGTWDFSDQGGAANSAIPLHDIEGRKITLPTNAVITNCLIDVATQPTSSTSSGTIAISSNGSADVKAAALVTTYTTAQPIVCVPEGSVGNMIKMSSEAQLNIQTGSEALTAGKLNVYIQYVLSG